MKDLKMINKLLTLSLALLVGLAFGHAINNAAGESAAREVYAVCNSAHQEISGASEQRCGELQDKYNIEFLCSDTSAGINCWTEIK